MALEKVGEILRTEVKIEWKIPNFFSLSAKVDEYVASHPFFFRGRNWYIRLYPNGETGEEDYISVYLILLQDKGSPITLTFRLALKSAYGTLKKLLEDTCTFAKGKGWGTEGFRRSVLLQKKADFLPSGVLTIVCILKMGTEAIEESEDEEVIETAKQIQPEHVNPELVKASSEVVHAATQTPSECSFGKLSDDLNGLLVSGEGSDLTVTVKRKEFRLHQGIMGARTPVFHSMFHHEMREKATGMVSIDDCEVNVFQAFVNYVYSGKVDSLCTETVFDLFALADKYQVDELKSACFDFVKCSLSVDTFCDVVTLALTYDKNKLLQQAVNFLSDNMTAVMKTVKWMNFLKERHIEANELMLKAVSLKLNETSTSLI